MKNKTASHWLTDGGKCVVDLLDRLDERLRTKAFRRVLFPKNPGDAPAETLLTRIREARAVARKAKHGRKRKAAAE